MSPPKNRLVSTSRFFYPSHALGIHLHAQAFFLKSLPVFTKRSRHFAILLRKNCAKCKKCKKFENLSKSTGKSFIFMIYYIGHKIFGINFGGI